MEYLVKVPFPSGTLIISVIIIYVLPLELFAVKLTAFASWKRISLDVFSQTLAGVYKLLVQPFSCYLVLLFMFWNLQCIHGFTWHFSLETSITFPATICSSLQVVTLHTDCVAWSSVRSIVVSGIYVLLVSRCSVLIPLVRHLHCPCTCARQNKSGNSL